MLSCGNEGSVRDVRVEMMPFCAKLFIAGSHENLVAPLRTLNSVSPGLILTLVGLYQFPYWARERSQLPACLTESLTSKVRRHVQRQEATAEASTSRLLV